VPIYKFASRTHSSVKAFSSDETGSNLPEDYAPWYAVGSGAAIPVRRNTDPVAKAVERDGYFLVAGKTRTSSKRTAH
jgi:hypothetical protein